MIKFGSLDVKDIRIGEQQVKKVAVGSEIIWEKSVSPLPSGYTQVKYLQSSGTQYIVSNIYHNERTKIFAKYSIDTLDGNDMCVFGSRTASGQKGNTFISNQNYIWRAFFNQNIRQYLDGQSKQYVDVEYVVENGYDGTFINGIANGTYSYSGTYTADYPLCVFTFSTGGVADNRMFKGKIFYLIAEENGINVANLISCLDTNNTPCFYDTVTQQTFYNQGTGEFGYETMDGTVVAPT